MLFNKSSFLFTLLTLFGSTGFSQCANAENIYSFVYEGHSYEVVRENKTWPDAAACAVARGGYLAEINNEDEQNTILDELANNASIVISNTENQFGTASVWLGGSDAVTEGNWIWDGNNDGMGSQFWEGTADGSPVGGLFTNWGVSPAEPDNSGGQDHLTIIIKPSAVNYSLWNDLVATNMIYYLIEYDGILGVKDQHLINNIHIYPNPFKEVINITNNNTVAIQSVSLFNLAGQVVKTINKADMYNSQLAVADLEKGMYLMTIRFENGETVTQKVVK